MTVSQDARTETPLINVLVVESYAVVITTMWANGNSVRIVEQRWKE